MTKPIQGLNRRFMAKFYIATGLENVQKLESKTREIITANSNCHEVSVVNYQISNGVTEEVIYKLVGCEYDTAKKESEKIVEILKDSLDGFCGIKNFNLIFVGKRETKTIKYWKCKFKPY